MFIAERKYCSGSFKISTEFLPKRFVSPNYRRRLFLMAFRVVVRMAVHGMSTQGLRGSWCLPFYRLLSRG